MVDIWLVVILVFVALIVGFVFGYKLCVNLVVAKLTREIEEMLTK